MNDLARTGNLVEAALWGAISVYFVVRTCLATGDLRRVLGLLTISFGLFGVSDLIEAQTGA